MKKKLDYKPLFTPESPAFVPSKAPKNAKYVRYVIHLKVEYYEPQKKEKKADVETGRKSNVDDSRKAFSVALKANLQNEEALLIKEEYIGPSFTTAVLVDINREKRYEVLDKLRTIDLIDVMEPEVYEVTK